MPPGSPPAAPRFDRGRAAGAVDIGAELPEAELKPGVLLIQQDAGDLEASGGLFRLQLFQETVRQNTFTVRDEHHVAFSKPSCSMRRRASRSGVS